MCRDGIWFIVWLLFGIVGCGAGSVDGQASTTQANSRHECRDPCANVASEDNGAYCSDSTEAGFQRESAKRGWLYECVNGHTDPTRTHHCPSNRCLVAERGEPDTCVDGPAEATAPDADSCPVAQCSSPITPGAPIAAPAGKWTWVPIDGNRCRDGSPTGIGVRPSATSDRLLVYLEGGGACFNAISCANNAASFGPAAFGNGVPITGGIFDLTNPRNPFRDWNLVFVPYCTGDVHAGAAENASVPFGPSGQHFVGYGNVTRALARLVPTFSNAKEVVLAGISAGGLGAALNYDQVARAFCPRPVTLIDDSGPLFSDQYLAPCLQKRWRTLWKLDETLPADCSACRASDGGGLASYFSWLGTHWPAASLGLISSDADSVVSSFFGFGTNKCAYLDLIAPAMPAAEFRAGLLDARARHIEPDPNFGSYFIPSTQHTWIRGPSLYDTISSGVPLLGWINALLSHGVSNVGM